MKKQCWFFHNWEYGSGRFWETPRGNSALDFTRKPWEWRMCAICGKVEAQVVLNAKPTGECFNECPTPNKSKEEAKKISTKSYTKRSTKCPKCGYYD